MWPLKPKPVVDADAAAWHVENFAWLARQFGHSRGLGAIELVLPRPGYFTVDGEQGHALAERIFAQVSAYCLMSDWDVELIADDNPLARHDTVGLGTAQKYALGSFGSDGRRIQITYVPALLRRPEQLIATFAHELAHYLLAAAEYPICAEDERECLTDLTAVFMGFGVFLANARFSHEAYDDGMRQGWRIGHSGYLPERDLVYALALFLRAKQLGADEACACLKPHLARLLRRAMQQLPDDHDHVAQIRAAMAEAEAAVGALDRTG